MSAKDNLNSGDMNRLGATAKAVQVGSILYAGGVRMQRETLDVASAAATPTYTVLHLLHAKTTGTGAAGEKAPLKNGATPSAGEAAPNAGGTSIVFHAETTGTGTVDVAYLTGSPPLNAAGVAASALTDTVTGVG